MGKLSTIVDTKRSFRSLFIFDFIDQDDGGKDEGYDVGQDDG
jgi:hypothetical protein